MIDKKKFKTDFKKRLQVLEANYIKFKQPIINKINYNLGTCNLICI